MIGSEEDERDPGVDALTPSLPPQYIASMRHQGIPHTVMSGPEVRKRLRASNFVTVAPSVD